MRVIILCVITLLTSSVWALSEEEVVAWQQDLAVYRNQIQALHIDPFHSLDREAFLEEIAAIEQSLPSINRDELLLALMRLTRRIDDGHTSLPLWSLEMKSLPLQLRLFGNQVYVIGTTDEHAQLLGARLLSINGVDAARITEQFSSLTPFSENPYSTAVRVADYMVKAELLHGLGFSDSVDQLSARFELQGQALDRTLTTSVSPELSRQLTYLEEELFQPMASVNDALWFGASADGQTVYIRFHAYTSHEAMEKLATELYEFVTARQSRNVIIDLRDNTGGDFFVGLKLAQALVLADSIDWLGGVYTLIDNVTFSAAMSNASQFARILNARLIGEPSGARPSGYQDMGQFMLPNSGLEVTYSKRLYRFGDSQAEALIPETQLSRSIDDYRNNNDRQLRWILADIAARAAN
ncbi:MAG: hypothetical protein MRY76_10995 [Pseudomonadales bacterium]|nr:hypothetical protein [Pseudomonadales bacterium]